MKCRKNCGACCIFLSVSSSIPGMETGKPAGIKCIHLSEDFSCAIYEFRPDVCRNFHADIDFCGNSYKEAAKLMSEFEKIFSLEE